MMDYKQKSAQLKLNGDCSIYEICDLYKKLSEQLQAASVITIDLSSVERLDASFLQLLVFVQLEAKRNKTKLEIKGVSGRINEHAAHIYCHILSDNTDYVPLVGNK